MPTWVSQPRACAAASSAVVSLFMTQLLILFPAFGNPALNVYLFRSESGLESEAEAAKAIYRTWMWAEHFRLASHNPLLGIGTFDFGTLSTDDPLFSDLSNGSETYLTGLLARVGLLAVLLFASFGSAMLAGIRSNDDTRPVVGLFLFVAMLAYGSFINAYDFVFLVMIGLLARGASESVRSPFAHGSVP